jgi:hypothetical protein
MNAMIKDALALFRDDVEAACAILVATAESAASGSGDEIDDAIDDLLESAEEAAKDGFVIVEREAIEALRPDPYDVSGDLEDALENFNWAFTKALRELKQALIRETGATA